MLAKWKLYTNLDSEWSKVILLLSVVALSLLVYRESVVEIASQWQSSFFRYAAIAPLLSVGLLVFERKRLTDVSVKPEPLGVPLLAATSMLWLLGHESFTNVAEHFAVFLIVNAAAFTFLGGEFYKRVSFYLGLLVFCIPFGASVVPLLMETTSDIASALMTLFGITHHRSGVVFTLPAGQFEVAEICSGFKFLSVGAIVGVIAARQEIASVTWRIVFLTLLPFVLILTNGIRAFVVMAVASATKMQWFVGFDHVVFGWFLFALVLFGIIFAAARLPLLIRQSNRAG